MPRHRCSIYTVTMRQTEEEDRICRICGHFIYPVLPFLPPPSSLLDFSPAYEETRKSAVTRNTRGFRVHRIESEREYVQL